MRDRVPALRKRELQFNQRSARGNDVVALTGKRPVLSSRSRGPTVGNNTSPSGC